MTEKYFVFYVDDKQVERRRVTDLCQSSVLELIQQIAENRGIYQSGVRVSLEWQENTNKDDSAEFEKAVKAITEMHHREYGDEAANHDVFSNLQKIPLAYSTTEDEEHEIQVYADLVGLRMISMVDDTCVEEITYENLGALASDIEYFDFDVAIGDAISAWEEEKMERQRKRTRKTNRYQELQSRQQEEFNTLPLRFAFGQEQFNDMMAGWGLDPQTDTDKIISIGAGGYIQPKDVPLFLEMSNRHKKEMAAAIAEDKTGEGFIYEMFLYELRNHEFGYTGETEDALNALGYSEDAVQADPRLKRGLEKAIKQIQKEDC